MITINDIKEDDVLVKFGKILNTRLTVENWNTTSPSEKANTHSTRPVFLKLSGQTMLFDYFRKVFNTRIVPEHWLSKVMHTVTIEELDQLDELLASILARNDEISYEYMQDELISSNIDKFKTGRIKYAV